ncbi:MAG TPA: MobF family relaxase [Acidimicrobiales bacterium]|nr:MobF family relaxase [Acidimicrobiales bacterium]
MLTVAKVARGGEAYYLATAPPQGAGPLLEPAGYWLGTRARDLGPAAVDRSTLGALLEGVDAVTGEVRGTALHRRRIVAFDCTFSAPKSASVLFALGAPETAAALREAHDASVAATLAYLERRAARVRREVGGERVAVPADGFAAAAFVHRTSRAPDPHLHTHVLVANVACDAAGRASALDARALYAQLRTAGALYRAQLRFEVAARLDVRWELRRGGFADLVDVPRSVLLAFSRRQEAILEELAASGRHGVGAARAAALRTRPAKDLETPYEALVEAWWGRARALGLSQTRLAELAPARRPGERTPPEPGEVVEALRLLEGLERACRRDELVRHVAGVLPGGAPVRVVEAAVDAALASGRLVAARTVARRLGRGRRLPAGGREPLFVPAALAAAERRVAVARAAAPGVTRSPGAPSEPLLVCEHHPGQRVAAEVLFDLARAATLAGRPAAAIAADGARAAYLEAVVGVAAQPPARADALAAGGMVLVEDGALGAATLDRLVGRARELAGTVVLVPRVERLDLTGAPAGARGPLGVLEEGCHRVELVERPAGLMARAQELLAAARRDGRDARLVLAAGRVSGDAARLGGRPPTELVVLGGATSLPRALLEDPSVRRVHLAVAPLRRVGAERRARALARPASAVLARDVRAWPSAGRTRRRDAGLELGVPAQLAR